MKFFLNYPILNYMTERNSCQEDLLRQTKPQSAYLEQPRTNDYIQPIPRYNGKPADLIFANTPFKSRPLLLDKYGEEYVDGRDLQIINTTNTRPVEVSGYYLRPELFNPTPIKTSQELKVVGILL